MVSVTEREMEIIVNIVKSHVNESNIMVFGSRYYGTNRKFSDLDIAIRAICKIPLAKLGKIRDAFEESELPYQVDVLDYNSISPEFRKIIDSGCCVI